jgi:hypothetical protein
VPLRELLCVAEGELETDADTQLVLDAQRVAVNEGDSVEDVLGEPLGVPLCDAQTVAEKEPLSVPLCDKEAVADTDADTQLVLVAQPEALCEVDSVEDALGELLGEPL